MKDYRLSDLLDVTIIQKMADAHYRAAGMPIGIIDAFDDSILVGAGWQDICVQFHRANPDSLLRCQQSDNYIKERLVEGEACHYKCQNGLWDIGMPIVVAGRHLATMFLGQFFYEGETPDREFFTQLAHQFNFNVADYLAALDRVPVFKREKVEYILEYNKALASFIADLARHALSIIETDEKVKRQSDLLQHLIDAIPYPVFYKDRQGLYLSSNCAFERFCGMPREQIAGKRVSEIAPKGFADEYQRADDELFAHPGTQIYEGCVLSADGVRKDVIFHKATFDGPDGAPAGIVGVIVDITERNRIEKALQESEAKLRSILDNIGLGVALISPGMEILEMNRRMRKWFPGVDSDQCPICFRAFNDPPLEQVCSYCPSSKTLRDGKVHEATLQTRQTDKVRNYRIISSPLRNASGEITASIEIVEDITEKLSLESQLRQAQKMEAVGRLAGGVAHDFNNMLGVIIGYAELALRKVDPAQPLHADLDQICKAAGRSTEIVRQLLGFARKQTIAPRILDLNEAVEGILKMLRRLIGEDIDLVWHSDSGLWPVRMDPTQVEQILANLCVNARDAIADTGKITIQTSNVTIDQAYCVNHAGFEPGQYAMLAISDDGCGMEAATIDKIFEPFFTTKQVGKGTGLGLATVYGIVKQNDGFIYVYSEQEKGTTFKIYLPRHTGQSAPAPQEIKEKTLLGRGETVMVVEDEVAVLELTCRMLDVLGYTVLAAGSPGEAMTLAESHPGEIHLLLTDVILPDMNGRSLAEKIKVSRPTMKCLYMSGYTANVIAHRGILDHGVQFLPKPFSERELSVKVKDALDQDE